MLVPPMKAYCADPGYGPHKLRSGAIEDLAEAMAENDEKAA